ncbi:MAG TPA: Na+/H+ antiporter NhaA, partial [Aldersonia sp.]
AGLAGMAVPIGIYLAINAGRPSAHGWGVAMSTDTALALGLLALLGRDIPDRMRVFVLTVFVVDDLVALAVIALVYSEDISLASLVPALVAFVLLLVAVRLRLRRRLVYVGLGVVLWAALSSSGIDPVVAGLVIGLAAPAYTPTRNDLQEATGLVRRFREEPTPEFARSAQVGLVAALSPNARLQAFYHPWTSYVIVPIFALANAGVRLTSDTLRAAATSPLTWGIVAGLVVGKLVGITGATVLIGKLRPGSVAPGMTTSWIAGGAALSGIGFTISLFIVDLALDDPALQDQARVGVLAATVLATLLGWMIFAVDRRLRPPGDEIGRRLLRPIDPSRDHIRGPVGAQLTLVEYGDFECPFCSKATGSIRDVRMRLGDSLRYVFRHLPLEEYHPAARYAAEAAEAAGAQGRFWEMHDLLFRNHDALTPDDIRGYAEELGLDLDRFDEDLRTGRHAVRVDDDAIDAESSEVMGTPTFYLGAGAGIPVRHSGPFDADTLITALESQPRP